MQRFGLPPEEIERRSLALVESAIPSCSGWTSEAREIVKRMVYAAGDLALAGLARVHPDAVEAGLQAIRSKTPMICDVRMVAAGLRPYDGPIEVAVDRAAQESALTRTAAGMLTLASELDGGIALIGNAPTALLTLLDMVDEGRCQPALIVATPVGFVAASESKQALLERDLPSITVEGTRGGSAIAAAAMNALLILASARQQEHGRQPLDVERNSA
jgi:precorrin-8X/cobalt-precorrin-8 methylmutase